MSITLSAPRIPQGVASQQQVHNIYLLEEIVVFFFVKGDKMGQLLKILYSIRNLLAEGPYTL